MRFVFDLDDTLCHGRKDGRYHLAEPIPERIERVNALYHQGHTIVIYTARGDLTGEDWRERTVQQLRDWGLHFHRFEIKPFADVYVDDRAMQPEAFFG